MVADLIRDSPFGHCVRLVTRNKYFQYPEEKDPNLWKKYVNQEKSGYVAHHGDTQPPDEEVEELRQARGVREREDSESSSRTQVGDGEGYNHASGVRVDPEKGKDQHVIDWYGPEDPAVCYRIAVMSTTTLISHRTHVTGVV
jgi:DHA1 family multidrug resistance protein-like MFS transporter